MPLRLSNECMEEAKDVSGRHLSVFGVPRGVLECLGVLEGCWSGVGGCIHALRGIWECVLPNSHQFP